MTPEDNNDIIIDLSNSLVDLSKSKKTKISKNITPDQFMDLVSNEVKCIKRCNKIIRKIEKYLGSDEFIFSLEPRDLIRLMESVSRSKYASLAFLAKLYDSSTKNDILRSYFQEAPITGIVGRTKNDIRIREIANEIRRKAREVKDEFSSED